MKITKLSRNEYYESIAEIKDLFYQSFGKEISENYLKWRYIDNPIKDFFVFVAIDENKIVGNYSVSPANLVYKGKEIKSALSMTTMTHPDYAGRGIFTKLASKAYENMKENNYELVWGFPNDNSHRTFIKRLMWNDIYEIPTMRKKIDEVNKEPNGKYQIYEDNLFEYEYDYNKSEKITRVKKDQSYLKWRYGDNPVNNYYNFVIKNNNSVTSYLVFKKFDNNQVDVVDYFFSAVEEGEELLSKLISYCSNYKIDFINTWSSIHSVNHLIFEKYGFRNASPITYFGKRNLKSFKEPIFDSYKNWNIQMGDSDVY